MIVAGGTYGERCLYPDWDRIFGSGLRAAIAASGISTGTSLYTYVPDEWRDDVMATLYTFGIVGNVTRSERPFTFEYLDTMEKSLVPSRPDHQEKLIHVEGDVILRFGMIEGEARAKGERVIYDPQSSGVPFGENGSVAKQLALIIAERELPPANNRDQSWESQLRERVIAVRDSGRGPQVILVKDAFGGLTVFLGDEFQHIPSYAAESYFRIGAGDVIATAFAYAWGERRMDPFAAADYAARASAFFVEGPRLPLPPPEDLNSRTLSRIHSKHLRIYGVGDYEIQSLALRTNNWINELDGTVQHLVLDEARGVPDDQSLDLVIIGSRTSNHEAERIARLVGAPAVVFWPGSPKEWTQVLFPRSVIATDYAGALYHAMRRPVP